MTTAVANSVDSVLYGERAASSGGGSWGDSIFHLRPTTTPRPVVRDSWPKSYPGLLRATDYAPGKSLNAIATALNDEGVPTANCGRWYASTVQHVLRYIEVDEELLKVRSRVTS